MAGSIPAASGRIFMSYRREETAYPAGWLYDRLADRFGGGQVFKDVDSIELGDDFVEVITAAVGSCDVLLALIGEEWLTISDAHGRRRLDDPDDFVRLEIQAALTRKVRVIPILVDGARMPRADELPDSLAKLVRRQALELSPSRFDFDTSRLLKVLDRTLAELRTAQDDASSMREPAEKTPKPSTTKLPKAPERRDQVEPRPTPSLPPATPATLPAARPPAGQSRPPDRSTRPPAGVDHRAAPQARVDRRLLVAGQLAIVGAALLVAGLFPGYVYADSLWRGRPDVIHMRWYALYAVILTTLAVGAGACTLIPRTRRFIGPGFLLGIVAASTWGLLFLVSDRLRNNRVSFGDGWRLELIAHLVLVLAAGLAGLALARTAEVRLVRRPPQGELAWLVALLGGVGALALFFRDQNLWRTFIAWRPDRWYVVPSIWMTVMALVVPACAAVAVPRRFGVALLAGWIGGAAAFFLFHYLWDSYQYGGNIGRNPIITFGCTLLALLVVTVLFARAAPRSQVERTTSG